MIEQLHTAPLDKFWYWINERHKIYLARACGTPKPWSKDEIFQTYKFTNVFRQLDTGTSWLRNNFVKGHQDDKEVLLFNICWYRLFNLVQTAEMLGYLSNFDSPKKTEVYRKLAAAYAAGQQIFTSAHMVVGIANEPKYKSAFQTMKHLWNDSRKDYVDIRDKGTLRNAFELLKRYPMIGPFVAYEIVTDLRHTAILRGACDINTYANVGPGAMRALLRLYGYENLSQREALLLMQELLDKSKVSLGQHVWPLELRDIEHSLCEFDKYCRVEYGEGRPRQRYPGGKE